MNPKVIDFVGKKKIFYSISLGIMVIGIIFNFIFGTEMDIQFTGGSMIKYNYSGDIDQDALQTQIQSVTPDERVSFTVSDDLINNTHVITVEFSGKTAITTELQNSITVDLQKNFPENGFELQESTSVEPYMGVRFLLKCLVAVAVASIFLVLYVTVRFRKIGGVSAGVTALIALFHDVMFIYFVYVIFRMPIDGNFIAVVLTILGYSLNDTIIIYDRVREERRVLGPKASIEEVFNYSCTKVVARAVYTSVATLLAIAVVYVVAIIYNLDSVKSFAFPMMMGIISGCYSTLFIAGPLWVQWKNYKAAKAAK